MKLSINSYPLVLLKVYLKRFRAFTTAFFIFSSNSAFFLHDHTFYKRGKFEIEANEFAAELLIDEDKIYKIYLMSCSIDQLASVYAVPIELVQYKFLKNKSVLHEHLII